MGAADASDPEFREKLLHAFERLTPEEMKHIDARWKSDMDKKVDRLLRFANTYEEYLKLCLERELDSKKIRRAVIEKSLAGAIWVMASVVAIALWNYAREAIGK